VLLINHFGIFGFLTALLYEVHANYFRNTTPFLLYRHQTDAARSAIDQYAQIAKANGMSLTELSLRWCRQRSLITTTLVGHSNLQQLEESIKYLTMKKPLSDKIMWDIDVVHMQNRLPMFSSNRVGKDWNGEGEIGEPIP
jgi:aryl-alcohol dehydrogenase-like predicted oxidoreductase